MLKCLNRKSNRSLESQPYCHSGIIYMHKGGEHFRRESFSIYFTSNQKLGTSRSNIVFKRIPVLCAYKFYHIFGSFFRGSKGSVSYVFGHKWGLFYNFLSLTVQKNLNVIWKHTKVWKKQVYNLVEISFLNDLPKTLWKPRKITTNVIEYVIKHTHCSMLPLDCILKAGKIMNQLTFILKSW